MKGFNENWYWERKGQLKEAVQRGSQLGAQLDAQGAEKQRDALPEQFLVPLGILLMRVLLDYLAYP